MGAGAGDGARAGVSSDDEEAASDEGADGELPSEEEEEDEEDEVRAATQDREGPGGTLAHVRREVSQGKKDAPSSLDKVTR